MEGNRTEFFIESMIDRSAWFIFSGYSFTSPFLACSTASSPLFSASWLTWDSFWLFFYFTSSFLSSFLASSGTFYLGFSGAFSFFRGTTFIVSYLNFSSVGFSPSLLKVIFISPASLKSLIGIVLVSNLSWLTKSSSHTSKVISISWPKTNFKFFLNLQTSFSQVSVLVEKLPILATTKG